MIANINSTWMENIHQVGKDCAVSAETQGGGRELQFRTPVRSGATESWLRLLRAGPTAKICPSGSYSTSGNLWGWQRWCSSPPEGVAPTWVVTNECHLLKDNPRAKSHVISPTSSNYATDPMEICPGKQKVARILWLGYFFKAVSRQDRFLSIIKSSRCTHLLGIQSIMKHGETGQRAKTFGPVLSIMTEISILNKTEFSLRALNRTHNCWV